MTGRPGWRAFSAAMMRFAGASAKSSKSRPRSDPAQLSNSLTTSAPACTCADRYSMVPSVMRSISAENAARSRVLERMRRALVGRAAPGDHVGGHGPGRTGKADQRGVASAVRATGCGRFHRSATGFRGCLPPGAVRARPPASVMVDRRGPSPVTNHRSAPKRLRQQQDIGKQDRRVKAIAADRLQGDLGRQIGVVAQLQEIARLRPCRAVFRQVAPRLPHHPDRRCGLRFARQRAQDRLGHGQLLCAPVSQPKAGCQAGGRIAWARAGG